MGDLAEQTAQLTRRELAHPRNTQLALLAALEALGDAGWQEPADPQARQATGVALGASVSGVATLLDNQQQLLAKGYRGVSPLLVPACLPSMAAGLLAIRGGFMGPNVASSTACATGAHTIGWF